MTTEKLFLVRLEDNMLDIEIIECIFKNIPTYCQLQKFLSDNTEYEITVEQYNYFVQNSMHLKFPTRYTEYFVFGRYVDFYGE